MQNEGPAGQVLAPRRGVAEEAVGRRELGVPAAGRRRPSGAREASPSSMPASTRHLAP